MDNKEFKKLLQEILRNEFLRTEKYDQLFILTHWSIVK